jgi:hypothetical protein
MIGLVFGIVFSMWVYRTVERAGARPVWWTIGTLLIWPIFSIIVGVKYKERGLVVTPIAGLLALLAAGAYTEYFSTPPVNPVVVVLGILWFMPCLWILASTYFGQAQAEESTQRRFPLGITIVTIGFAATLAAIFLVLANVKDEVERVRTSVETESKTNQSK